MLQLCLIIELGNNAPAPVPSKMYTTCVNDLTPKRRFTPVMGVPIRYLNVNIIEIKKKDMLSLIVLP